MASMEQALDTFLAALLECDVYKTYREMLDKVKEYPELKQQIDEFRMRNYEMQISNNIDYDKLDAFEREYENFREQPLVADFLAAELDLCRMMQEMYAHLTEALEFE